MSATRPAPSISSRSIRWLTALVAACLCLTSGEALARRKKKDTGPPKPNRIEFGALPAINYDTDLGFGFGAIASVARFAEGYRPYKWRLELQAYATVKRAPGKGAEFPFHDDYLNMDFPGLLQNRLRITGRVGFRKFANTGYYGFGNDSKFDKPWEAIDPDEDLAAYQAAHRYHSFDHIYPLLLANARIRLWDRSLPEQRKRIEALVGINTTYNIVNPYPGSKLEQDIASLNDDTKDAKTLGNLLRGTDPALLLIFNLGLLFDTRDHEFTPTRGTFTEVSVRSSPGVQQGLHYAAFAVNSAWYKALVGEYLSFAIRGVADVIVGDAPFYELTRFGALQPRDGPGGGWSLRGVPRQRYSGKVKLIQNMELRSLFWRFNVGKSRFVVGAVAFLDAARIWADTRATELAGMNVDGGTFKVGTGGGLRVRWGETLVIRFDGAYSPTEHTPGFYVDIGHVF